MTLRNRSLALLASCCWLAFAPGAIAGDKPLYQPAPDWVKPAPPSALAPQGPNPPAFLVLDSQQRLKDGQVWRYTERASRIASAQELGMLGTVSIEWQPDQGDLIVHGVDILRDGQRIDALRGGAAPFTVLRRETALERRALDGRLTATLAVEGLRVGDVLDVRYSVTVRDPALQGNVDALAPVLAQPLPLGFGRSRLLWPEGQAMHWKVYPQGATPVETRADGWHELSFSFPVARQPDRAPAAPGRFNPPAAVELSSFADWSSLSRVMAPLYRTDGLIVPGSPLAAEVARIAAASPDPRRRVAAALALVQEKVRYLYKGMENGNLVPQTPAQTWETRYGDCKAKTLLLLALLHALGVDAEPALANLDNGDLVRERIPSALAFNHVFVLAHLGESTLWLDGTGQATQLADLDDVGPYGWVLPVRAAGADLLAAPNRAPAVPRTGTTLTIDARGGINLPAVFEMKQVVRGAAAGALQTAVMRLDRDGRNAMLQAALPNLGVEWKLADSNVSYDAANAAATITLTGVVLQRWRHGDDRYRFDLLPNRPAPLPDRSRTNWKDVPIAGGTPMNTVSEYRILLPDAGKGFTLEGADTVDVTLPGGNRALRSARIEGDAVLFRLQDLRNGREIAPADFAPLRAALAGLANRAPRISSPVGYPPPWTGVVAARRAHRFDRALELLGQRIADKPDDAQRYVDRARFLTLLFDRDQALADFGKAVSLAPSKEVYVERAGLYRALGQRPQAVADLKAALELDPGDADVIARLAVLQATTGAAADALALVQDRIDQGGRDAPRYLMIKANVLSQSGDAAGAIAAANAAVEQRPGTSGLLNERCWIRGLNATELDLALKDCTRAIELGESGAAQALDSRALVYLRLGRLDEAMADLKAALDMRPGAAGTLFLRSLVEARRGNRQAAAADLAAARLLAPAIDEDYARFGLRAG